jgi:hypothetical protein
VAIASLQIAIKAPSKPSVRSLKLDKKIVFIYVTNDSNVLHKGSSVGKSITVFQQKRPI